MESYFISDLHIKDINERNGIILLRFLNFLRHRQIQIQSGVQLFLLGDVFDFWLSGHQVFVQRYQSIVDAIAELKKIGVKVFYFEGNHDLHIDEFWTKKLGVEVFVDPQYFQLGPFSVRLEHGDLINLDDEAYLKYRALIRNPWVEIIGHVIPGAFWNWFGSTMSKKSRGVSSQYRAHRTQQIIKMVHTHAERAYLEKPFDIIVTGHMHVFDVYKKSFGEREITSYNLGSWLESPNVLRIGKSVEWFRGDEFLDLIKPTI